MNFKSDGERGPILVVDDDPDIRDVLREVFEMEGHAVIVASNGFEALELMNRERPQVIFTDISMPLMNGLELRQRIKSNPVFAEIPVFVCSAASKKSASFPTDIDNFIAKPFDFDVLIEKFNSCGSS